MIVIKRDGRKVTFDPDKIYCAICLASENTKVKYDKDIIDNLMSNILNTINKESDDSTIIEVEQIQDIIINEIKKADLPDLAKTYERYRKRRTKIRNNKTSLMKAIKNISELDASECADKRENANIDGNTAMGTMLKYGTTTSKEYYLDNVINPEHSELHRQGYIHIHDLDFYGLTTTCATADTKILLKIDDIARPVTMEYFDEYFKSDNLQTFNFNEAVQIFSGDKFVKLISCTRRPLKPNEKVYNIQTQSGELHLTAEHKVPIVRGNDVKLVYVKELAIGDKLIKNDTYSYQYIKDFIPDLNDNNIPYHKGNKIDIRLNLKRVPDIWAITNIDYIDYNYFVYDVETENHYFNANGFIIHNCTQIDVGKLLKTGFSTGHGHLRSPNSITTASALTCIIIQSNQGDQHGGQAIPKFDYDLAPYIDKSFITNICKYLDMNDCLADEVKKIKETLTEYSETNKSLLSDSSLLDIKKTISQNITKTIDTEACVGKAIKYTDKETYQAMEALIHNLNTMNCLPENERLWVIDTFDNKENLKLMTIKDIYNTFESNRYLVMSYNKNDDIWEWKHITACINNGKRDSLITTISATNHYVNTTDNHRLICRDENDNIIEVFPKDVKEVIIAKNIPGYHTLPAIALDHYHNQNNQNYLENHIPLTHNLAELLGYFVAIGEVCGTTEIRFATNNLYLHDRIVDIMSEIYPDIEYDDDYNNILNKKTYSGTYFNVGKIWCECFKDICGGSINDKHIPSIILQNNDTDYLIEFLRAYFKCNAVFRYDIIDVITASETLLLDINFALMRLGELPYYIDDYIMKIDINTLAHIGLDDLLSDFGKQLANNESHLKNLINTTSRDMFAIYSEYESSEYNGDVYDISVADNENFINALGILVHNSRAGAQTPFSSINYGTDTSPEGRMVIKNVLLAQEAGLGNGETPIFPIHIFKVKEGVNYNPTDPNYDLFKLACKVSAKRLFPKHKIGAVTNKCC